MSVARALTLAALVPAVPAAAVLAATLAVAGGRARGPDGNLWPTEPHARHGNLAQAIAPAAFDPHAFVAAVSRAGAAPVRPMPGARVVFVPHHAPAGYLTAGALRDLATSVPTADVAAWERVVVLGPDHRKAGARAATTTSTAWTTPAGRVDGDAASVARLLRSGVVDDDATLLALEHSIGELVPFLARYLPGTNVVPLAVRADANHDERARMVAALGAVVDERTVIVVSADFAHDVAPHEARRNDIESVAALVAMDLAALRGFGDEHLDARAATAIAMQLAEGLGASRFVVRDRADGSELRGYAGGPVTSYITGYYAPP